VLDSQFRICRPDGSYQTCCHPDLDLLAVRVESALLDSEACEYYWHSGGSARNEHGRLGDAGTAHHGCSADWKNRVEFTRKMDETQYHVSMPMGCRDLFSNAQARVCANWDSGKVLAILSVGFRKNPIRNPYHLLPKTQSLVNAVGRSSGRRVARLI